MRTATPWRRITAVAALVVTALALLVAAPASAAPKDPEGGSKKLHDAMQKAATNYVESKAKLDGFKKQQSTQEAALKAFQNEAAGLQERVIAVATKSYKLGQLGGMSALLSSSSSENFIEKAGRVNEIAERDSHILVRYQEALISAAEASKAIQLSIKQQQAQVDLMAKRKAQAEKDYAAVGISGSSGGFVDANSPDAQPAPKNSDGNWPKESCSVKDPTTSGCITPRLLHAYQEARAAGFTHYTSCFSQRSSGEHPLGRACDFSANATTFKTVAATGADKAYGDRLAAFLVKNAERLGVMYVIWYRQFWQPGRGWGPYSGRGDAAAVHTNHVHLSIL